MWISIKVRSNKSLIDINVFTHQILYNISFVKRKFSVCTRFLRVKNKDLIIGCDININLQSCDPDIVDYLDCIYSGDARKVVTTRYSSVFFPLELQLKNCVQV